MAGSSETEMDLRGQAAWVDAICGLPLKSIVNANLKLSARPGTDEKEVPSQSRPVGVASAKTCQNLRRGGF